MKITIDEKVLKKYKVSLEEFLVALTFRLGESPAEVTDVLCTKQVLTAKDDGYEISQKWSEIIEKILNDSAKDTERNDEEIENLASQIRLSFPQGKKPDSNKYFRNNVKEIAQHLKKFFTVYGDYSNEEILDATKKYVESFHEDYRYMKLDKYFIIKDLRKEGGDITSDLATWLDNKGEDIHNDEDWTTKIV